MKALSSNRDLYDYLLSVIAILNQRGAMELSEIVRIASVQAGAISTEFLGESRIALRQVLAEQDGILTAEELGRFGWGIETT
jgi:hypothetical protein